MQGEEYCDVNGRVSSTQSSLAGATSVAQPLRASDEPDKRKPVEGLCRPISSCGSNDDCTTKKKKQNCECLKDDTFTDNEDAQYGYCINSKLRECDDDGVPLDEDVQACASSSFCPEHEVCLQLCEFGPFKKTRYCVNPAKFWSFCDAQPDPGQDIFGQGRDGRQSFLSFDRFGAKRDLRKRN